MIISLIDENLLVSFIKKWKILEGPDGCKCDSINLFSRYCLLTTSVSNSWIYYITNFVCTHIQISCHGTEPSFL